MKKLYFFLFKIFLAAILLSALVIFALRDMMSESSLIQPLIYIVIGATICVLLLAIVVVAQGYFNQFSLNHGATDAQWLGLPRDQIPPGLQKLRGMDAVASCGEGAPKASGGSQHDDE